MKQANPIILRLRKWSHLQHNPTPTFFSGRCCKTTCRPTNQERSESNLTIKGNFHVLLRHQNLPAVSAAVVLPPQSPTLKTAHGFRTAGIRPPIMGSLDRSAPISLLLYLIYMPFPPPVVSIFFFFIPMNANSILLLPFGFLLCFLVFGSSDSGIVTVDVKTADNLLHSGYAFLDVRLILG